MNDNILAVIVGGVFVGLILLASFGIYQDYQQNSYLCKRYYPDTPHERCIWMKKRLIPGTNRIEVNDV